MWKIFYIAIILFVSPLAMSKTIEVHGHRGARTHFPENTIPAMEHALEIGVDALEFDLGVTKDKTLVLAHDRRINKKICSAPMGSESMYGKPIFHYTFEQIRTLNCGDKEHPRFPLQKRIAKLYIPSLEEVFKYVKKSKHKAAKTVKFNIETKILQRYPKDTVSAKIFAKLLVAMIQKHKLEKRVIVQSFDFRTLEEVKRLNPAIQTSALFNKRPWPSRLPKGKLKPDMVSPNWAWLKKEDVVNAHAKGFEVVPYTANKPLAWSRLVKFGVDGIITDDPKALIGYLKKKNLR